MDESFEDGVVDEGSASMEAGAIRHFIPAVGWWAVYLWPDGSRTRVPLVAWAVRMRATEEGFIDEVVGMTAWKGEVDVAYGGGTFHGYMHDTDPELDTVAVVSLSPLLFSDL